MLLAVVHVGEPGRAEHPIRSLLLHDALDGGVIGDVEMPKAFQRMMRVCADRLVAARTERLEEAATHLPRRADHQRAHRSIGMMPSHLVAIMAVGRYQQTRGEGKRQTGE